MRRASSGVGLIQARLRRTWDGRRRMSEASDLLPAVLQEVAAQSAAPGAAGWVLHAAHLSGTQVVVLKVGPPGGTAAAVVKMPATAEGVASQRREADVLAALGAEESLGDLTGLVPPRLAQGAVAGRVFTVERLVPGVEGRAQLADPVAGPRVVDAAAAVIGELHRRTGNTIVVDDGVLERWVEARLRVLAAAFGDRAAMDRLASRLRGAFEGRSVEVAWVHGDFWPGNVIFDPATLEVTGIIDWEWAGPGELPAHDLLYLLIQTRMLTRGRELGHVLHALLEGAPWEPAERTILAAGGVIGEGEAAVEPEVLLLVWLRHVASNLVQSPGDARNWIWTSRNVESVLRLV